ncbi:TetR/AcrR family transcriptional regulator [Saccharothrix coeruleofusca]|uniref:TetR family transcriptional regulator n=1 Tax=Saccharothrix coeruleofusca TaxID=33919 RepID=A0A918AR01_9PSEU|nr:TetR/AcrR family transcriptional regulator [Saccharothrix coeruleofusca]MBP2337394.1 AcrR family transcriptional regulator [Saccharothrix coeruleofusca]GGP72461.1 TetR family transcriptional regulator [Saccharothrix coeruleofusca]
MLAAATEVFATEGVDASVRRIIAAAGVGAGTFYRHFPDRSALITAVFRHDVDACVETAASLADQYDPVEALTRWMRQVARFISDKYGLKPAMHSGDPAYRGLPAYFLESFTPVLAQFLNTAAAAGEIRADITPEDLMRVLSGIAAPDDHAYTDRMIDLLVDGLRHIV